MKAMKSPAVALLMIGLVACSSTSDGMKKPRRQPNLITAEELTTAPSIKPGQSVYDAIQFLRPQFLIRRGGGSSAMPVVYVDNIRRGGPETLNEIFVFQVEEIRYLSSSEATMRFGTGHPGGAILVKTGAKR